MYKVLIITLALYLFLEVLCHGFALFMRKCLDKAVTQNERKPLYLQFLFNKPFIAPCYWLVSS